MTRVFKGSFYALKSFLTGVLVLTGMLIPFFVLGITIFEDDFEAHELGDIHNQGGWYRTGGDETTFTVSNEVKIEGIKALKIDVPVSSSNLLERVGTQITTGKIVYHIKISEVREASTSNFMICDEGTCWSAKIICSDVADCDLWIFTYGVGWSKYIDIEPAFTWHAYTIQWNGDVGKIQLTLDDNTPSGWKTQFSLEYANKVRFQIENAMEFYVDYISETIFEPHCSIGYCEMCETYNTCVSAGCQWYYSEQAYLLFGKGGYCVEPIPPSEEECGTFYKCQYCSEELCGTGETEGWCEWVDKGAGLGCYMLEPEMPPEQVGWEVPELEDCSELSGVEKWLCEIKNFIAGIFMPSQEKLNNLYNTLGNFRTKFPFNYIMATDRFFKDVDESLEEEKSIPIKILGQEEEIDFRFWEETGEVGGVVENFASVVKDFSTLVLIIGFLAWLLTMIRRFWS